jgi:hypothetical protein
MPGGELFAAQEGEVREHRFAELIDRHASEWRHHVGRGGPEPISVPAAVSTTSASAGVDLEAYPEHSIRAAQVDILDVAPLRLENGWPSRV